jgi:L-threonylcarbamoyladenylate synthase
MARILPAVLPSGEVDASAISEAVRALLDGGVVALPTETVYGLAANALDAAAARRIYEAKGRPSLNPLIVHVLDVDRARSLAAAWPESAARLAAAFWPGPLTLIVPKLPTVPDEVTAGLPAVAIRVPSHPVFRAVLQQSGLALAAPSANRSNGISPTTAEHVATSLGDRVDLILDGGPCGVGIESTVVDVTGRVPTILRPGGLSAARIEAVIGPLGIASVPEGEAARASPGQLARHYAPNATTLVIEPDEVAATLQRLPSDARVAVLARTAARPSDARVVLWEHPGANPAEYARTIYASLHQADRAGATHILVENVPPTADWEAVRDRLRRASTKE